MKEINTGVTQNINWLPLAQSPTGDQTCNLGMCPDLGEVEPTAFWFAGQCSNYLSHSDQGKCHLIFFGGWGVIYEPYKISFLKEEMA